MAHGDGKAVDDLAAGFGLGSWRAVRVCGREGWRKWLVLTSSYSYRASVDQRAHLPVSC